MIVQNPIILVSEKIYPLVCMVEVLKTLLFPFEYQGLIIPFELRPNLKLILSSEPYIIGLEKSIYEEIKRDLDKKTAYVYDVDTGTHDTGNSNRIVRKINFPTTHKQSIQGTLSKKIDKYQEPRR